MNGRSFLGLWLLLATQAPLYGAEKCLIENHLPEGPGALRWVDRGNWLRPENLRIGLQSGQRFMPHIRITPGKTPGKLKVAAKRLHLDTIKTNDPIEPGTVRSIDFVLNSHLYADGIVVLRDGKILSEQYWNDLTQQTPRVLLGGTRPILSLLGTIAVAQGKLEPDKSIVQYIPELIQQKGLRRLSIQRLLEGSLRFHWTRQEIEDWQTASGWNNTDGNSQVRAWLNRPGRWDGEIVESQGPPTDLMPEDDLLIWALGERDKTRVSRVFCDHVLSKLSPENPILWLTDTQGQELAGGLALSLRDFAQLGQFLIDARNTPTRTKLPGWFIETLTASEGLRKPNDLDSAGLGKGSHARYGFVRLGGRSNRIAILGPFGNSLFIDFDNRLVIAIFASYPRAGTGALFSTLRATWESLSTATAPLKKN